MHITSCDSLYSGRWSIVIRGFITEQLYAVRCMEPEKKKRWVVSLVTWLSIPAFDSLKVRCYLVCLSILFVRWWWWEPSDTGLFLNSFFEGYYYINSNLPSDNVTDLYRILGFFLSLSTMTTMTRMLLLLVFSLYSTLFFRIGVVQAEVFSLSNLEWTLKNQNGSIVVPGSVPSQVHLDLLRVGIITEPLLGINGTWFYMVILEFKMEAEGKWGRFHATLGCEW